MTPKMNDEGLLECPFCGSLNGPSMAKVDGSFMSHYVVECNDCEARGGDSRQQKRAITFWNTRGGHEYTKADYEDAKYDGA